MQMVARRKNKTHTQREVSLLYKKGINFKKTFDQILNQIIVLLFFLTNYMNSVYKSITGNWINY